MSEVLPNPLRERHVEANAELQAYAQLEIVSTFGQPEAEYAAIRKSAGLMDLPQRSVLELTGKDRLAFLNNLLTNQTWDKASKTGLAAGTVIEIGVGAVLATRVLAGATGLVVGPVRTVPAEAS